MDRKGSSSTGPQNERGASLVEYGLLVALIAVVALVAVVLTGENVSTTFSTVTSGLESG